MLEAILKNLTTPVGLLFIGGTFGYFLGKSRDASKIVFNKKLAIYSDIVYHLSSTKYLNLNLNVPVEKLETLSKEIYSLNTSEVVELKCHPIVDKFTEVDKKNYKDELIKLFTPARLIGSKAVVDELREYFSLISEYYLINEKKDIDDVCKRISKSVIELEQLMRKDLGLSRVLSKLDIWWHVHKS